MILDRRRARRLLLRNPPPPELSPEMAPSTTMAQSPPPSDSLRGTPSSDFDQSSTPDFFHGGASPGANPRGLAKRSKPWGGESGPLSRHKWPGGLVNSGGADCFAAEGGACGAEGRKGALKNGSNENGSKELAGREGGASIQVLPYTRNAKLYTRNLASSILNTQPETLISKPRESKPFDTEIKQRERDI